MPVLGLPFSPALVLVLFIGTVAYSIVRYVRSPWRRLPPGPKGFPVIGNILQLRDKQWTTFTELKRSFGVFSIICSAKFCAYQFSGDLMYLNAAGQPLMVINSQKVAADLLDRRAGKSSGRPPLIVADVLTGGNVIVFLGYTDVYALPPTFAFHYFFILQSLVGAECVKLLTKDLTRLWYTDITPCSSQKPSCSQRASVLSHNSGMHISDAARHHPSCL